MQYFDSHSIKKIRQGFYSAIYFNRTQEILCKEKNDAIVTMQIFQKHYAVLSGIQQVIELFRFATGYFENNTWIGKWESIQINSLSDGTSVTPRETIMHITGPYAYFAHLESVYLGILSRQTKIATNAYHVTTAAGGKQVIFFADRFDYFLNQEIDGYAAKMGGITSVATPAQAFLVHGKPVGTLPHALIALNHGNTIAAAEQFTSYFPHVPLIALIDFHNDCVVTALQVAKKLGRKLWGVRLDTSETMIDASLQSRNDTTLTGVNKYLVQQVREALNKAGYQHVKIVVSGGFTAEKIAAFEKEDVPVDVYGVGSSLMKSQIDFTADIVTVNGKQSAKAGRALHANMKLSRM